MTGDISILKLLIEATIPVQLVMLILLLASVLSWTVIFQKWRQMRDAYDEADDFERRFWSGTELNELYRKIVRGEASGTEAVFEAGFREFAKLRSQQGVELELAIDGAGRAMRIVMTRQIDQLEHRLSFLATVGSTSPYIGLFGTVWGIMNAFLALGGMQHVTIATVAPGIAEALIATAMGLFAAIPAVIAYNRFVTDTERLGNRYDIFIEEFAGLLNRQARVAASRGGVRA